MSQFKAVSVNELLNADLPSQQWIAFPLIPEKGVSLICSPRGCGKSWLAISLAVACASGFDFANFYANKPRKVLYVDGEMSSITLKDRFNKIINGFRQNGKDVINDNVLLYGNDMQDENAPVLDFAKPESCNQFEIFLETLGKIDLIILDNIMTLYSFPDENSSASWQQFNNWCKAQRAKGRSLLWIHHTGKDTGSGARGSSAIETLMDASLLLTRPKDYAVNQGSVMNCEYTKSRSVMGDPIESFKLVLKDVDENSSIFVADLTDKQKRNCRVIELKRQGCGVDQICQEVGLGKSSVYNILKAFNKDSSLTISE